MAWRRKAIPLSNEQKLAIKVEKLGYTQSFQSLLQAGHKDGKLILKAIKKCNGNIEQAELILNSQEKQIPITDEQKLMIKVEKLGYSQQYQSLINSGHQDGKLVYKALKKCIGNKELAEQLLNSSVDKKNKKNKEKEIPLTDEQLASKMQDDDYQQQNHQSLENAKMMEETIQTNFDSVDFKPEKKSRSHLKKEEKEEGAEDKRKRRGQREKNIKEKPEKLLDESKDKKVWMKYKKRDESSSDSLSEDSNSGKREEKRRSRKENRIAEQLNVRKELEVDNLSQGIKKICLEEQKVNREERGEKSYEDSRQLCKTIKQGQFTKVVLDGNNCFYLEQSFMKKAIKGNFDVNEEKIATLMKIYQTNLDNAEVVIIYDNSKMITNQNFLNKFQSHNFSIKSARPFYSSADDAITAYAKNEKKENLQNVLFITSDRNLQSRLTEQGVSHIMGSKNFFNILKEEVIGKTVYTQIVDS